MGLTMHFLSGLPVKRKLTRVLALNAGIALALSAAGIVPYEYYHARRDAQRDLETAADMIGTTAPHPSSSATCARPRRRFRLCSGSAHRSHDSSRCDRRGIRRISSRRDSVRSMARSLLPPRKTKICSSTKDRSSWRAKSRWTTSESGGSCSKRIWATFSLACGYSLCFCSSPGALDACGAPDLLSAASFRLDPIACLANTARRIRDRKNYSLRAEKADEDEIGDLVNSFNEMLREIEDRDHLLEEQVQHRTEEKERAEQAARLKSEFLANMSPLLSKLDSRPPIWTACRRSRRGASAGVGHQKPLKQAFWGSQRLNEGVLRRAA